MPNRDAEIAKLMILQFCSYLRNQANLQNKSEAKWLVPNVGCRKTCFMCYYLNTIILKHNIHVHNTNMLHIMYVLHLVVTTAFIAKQFIWTESADKQ